MARYHLIGDTRISSFFLYPPMQTELLNILTDIARLRHLSLPSAILPIFWEYCARPMERKVNGMLSRLNRISLVKAVMASNELPSLSCAK